MTDQQYKDLQAWCAKSSNKRDPLYQSKVALRNKASLIRAQIRGYVTAIKDCCFWLNQSKDEAMIDKWTKSINTCRDQKILLQKQFNEL